MDYTKGLHQLTEGVYAYLQPDGGWGRSNAGLVRGGDSALLIDTFFDAPLTREMLAAMRPVTVETPIEVAVNTHGDGDHWFGNYELPGSVDIVSSAAAVEEMRTVTPQAMAGLVHAELDEPTRDYLRRAFGAFAFAESRPRLPSETFSGETTLHVGGTRVDLIEVGPAHTAGDLIVHVPSARTVFTGDILFIGGTPIIWDGPVGNWIAACDRILGLGADFLVPGHGPVTDVAGVTAVKRYLTYLRDEARQRFEAGLDARAAAQDIDLGAFAAWHAPERVAINVDSLYREFDPDRPVKNRYELMREMARYADRRAAH